MKNLTNQLLMQAVNKPKTDVMFKKSSFQSLLTSLVAIQDEAERLGYPSDDPKVTELLHNCITAAGWLDTDYIKTLELYESDKRLAAEKIENEKKDHTRKN